MFAILTIAFTLILFATIPIIWKLVKGVILLPFKIILGILGICYSAPATIPNYYAEDTSAIWVKGTNGRYFRYDLNDSQNEKQMDDLKEFSKEYL